MNTLFNRIVRAFRSSIQTQFTVLITLLALVSVAVLGTIIGVFAVNQTRAALEASASNQLEQTRASKASELRLYFNERINNTIVFSNNSLTQEAFNAFNTGFVSPNTIRSLYLDKPDLATAGDGSNYSTAHSQFGSYLTTLQDSFGYYDVFLINRNGQVIYTHAKEDDFGTSLKNGPYADSNLAQVYNDALKLSQGEIVISDFEFYAPSGDVPAAFIASPIYENGSVTGVLAFQLALDEITAIMQERTGLGETGETYLVGTDLLFRSESRFLENSLLNQTVNTDASNSALAGNSGSALIDDYRGVPVFSSWAPFDVGNLRWALLAEIDQSEALAPANQLTGLLTNVAVAVSLVIAIIAAFVAALLARTFSTPILGLTRTAEAIAEGDFDVQIETSRDDELGTLARAFKNMTSRLRQSFTEIDQRASQLATVADVGAATSSILDMNRLLQEVVDLIKERFNLYHSHIYLLDDEGQNLVLTAGAGEAGRIMTAEKRSIPLNREQSLVARAARERKGVTVNDVTKAPDFLPHPLLPDTRSELAVPMIVGNNLIGVFDIQSDRIGRFTEADINIQNTLAAQLATSIQNARTFEETRAQAEIESLANTIGQKIQQATTVEETLQVAIRELGITLGAPRVKANLNVKQQYDSDTAGMN